MARLLRWIALVLLFITPSAALPAAGANTLCVNQGGTGGCLGTIAAAINAAGSGDTILIAGAANPYPERLTINKSLSLIGDNPATTIIDAGHAGQVIRIGQAITVTLTNLTIRNGQAGTGNNPDQWGGGIHSAAASLTLNNVVVSGNRTGGLNGCCGGSGGISGGINNDSGTLYGSLCIYHQIGRIAGNSRREIIGSSFSYWRLYVARCPADDSRNQRPLARGRAAIHER